MKTTVILLAALLCQDGGKIEWSKDVEKSLEGARKAGKPVMMFFTADW